MPKLYKTNTTGVNGVSLVTMSKIPYYRATMYSKRLEKPLVRSFSCIKYGHAEAFRLAVEQRELWNAELAEIKRLQGVL